MIPERRRLITERLRLEPIDPVHAGALWAAAEPSLPELSPWLPWADGATAVTTRHFAERAPQEWAAGRDHAFAIRAEGRLFGAVSLHRPRTDRAIGELGYWIGTELTGRGYATEAARAVVGWGIETLGLYRLELRAGVENRSSQRVAEKVGFLREGTLRMGCPTRTGGYDCHLYGLLAQDWDGSR
jgi:ribosomal-protein-serine acetyltransferase